MPGLMFIPTVIEEVAPGKHHVRLSAPGYFDEEGKSPLPDVLGGDGPKTIGAVWEYIRLADKMPRPE